jgi:hypothetical protein
MEPSGISGRAPVRATRVYSTTIAEHPAAITLGNEMDSAWLSRTRARYVRMRWRRSGAWLWPAFVAFTVVDAALGHALPPSGDRETIAAAGVLALVANLLGVILLARPLGWVISRFRRDLPGVVARDYGGTVVVVALTATLLTVGLVHRPQLRARQQALEDAVTRAQAWIGDRAPDEFRRNLGAINVLTIQDDTIYRACVASIYRERTYCVVVNRALPFPNSVTFSGYEPNSALAAGTG